MGRNIIFVLGAGFSKAAGLPLQRELLPEIMSFDRGDLHFNNAKNIIKKFIAENFHKVEIDKLTLEDLFTILDKAVLGKEYFGGYGWQDLYAIRKGLVHTLMVLINSKMHETKQDLSGYNGLGQFVIDCQLKKDGRDRDIGIISLNWDTVFEFVINSLGTENDRNRIGLNYCVFSDSINGEDSKDLLRAGGDGTLKIMKLHGSINWLYCPNCGRLFIDRFNNIGVEYKKRCRYCTNVQTPREIILEEMIITPTILKEFQNHHLRLTWQHAFMELSRADAVVFIGYSFPLADYELRYLFKKALPKDVKLSAVLHHADETNGTKERYGNFFGPGIEFHFDGFKEWWQKSGEI